MRAACPDLVVSRICPGRQGIELLAAMRADPRTRGIPVLMLTSYPVPAVHASAREAGADEVVPLTMPPDPAAC